MTLSDLNWFVQDKEFLIFWVLFDRPLFVSYFKIYWALLCTNCISLSQTRRERGDNVRYRKFQHNTYIQAWNRALFDRCYKNGFCNEIGKNNHVHTFSINKFTVEPNLRALWPRAQTLNCGQKTLKLFIYSISLPGSAHFWCLLTYWILAPKCNVMRPLATGEAASHSDSLQWRAAAVCGTQFDGF